MFCAKSTPDLVLNLPMPPGINAAFVPAKNRTTGALMIVYSQAARRWLGDARLDVMAQRRGVTLTNRTAARISLAPSGFDADAPLKLLFDGIEKGGAVFNDRIIRPYFVTDDAAIRDGWLRVELWDSGEEYVRAKRDGTRDALVRTFGGRHGVGNRSRKRQARPQRSP